MKNKLLSICIPTFNRARYLEEAVGSVLKQLQSDQIEKIQICISDNGSTDETKQVIGRLQMSTPLDFTVDYLDRNMGADFNYLNVVGLANGKYCWFLGSDDALVDGAISKILNFIDSELSFDVALVNRIECDLSLLPISKRYWLRESQGTQVFNLGEQDVFIDYLNNSTVIGAVYSYLSSIIFKRDRWCAYSISQDYIGSAYSHVAKLFSLLQDGCNLLYVKDHLVYSRGFNDSFMDHGRVNRIMLDINGYGKVMDDYVFDVRAKASLKKLIKRERPSIVTLAYLRNYASDAEWRSFLNSFERVGYSRNLISFYTNYRFVSKVVCLANLFPRFGRLVKRKITKFLSGRAL